MSDIHIPFGRCFCIHSHLQFVDVALQSLLLHHGVLSTPLIAITETPSSSLQKTIKGIEAVRDELREIFRSAKRRNVVEVRLHIGSTPHRPSHIYELPVAICDDEGSTMVECGNCCQQLTDGEKRTLNRHFFMQFPVHSGQHKTHDRVFVFLRTTPNAISENLQETDLDSSIQRSKTTRIHLIHEGCDLQIENKDTEAMTSEWMRLVPFIVSSKE